MATVTRTVTRGTSSSSCSSSNLHNITSSSSSSLRTCSSGSSSSSSNGNKPSPVLCPTFSGSKIHNAYKKCFKDYIFSST